MALRRLGVAVAGVAAALVVLSPSTAGADASHVITTKPVITQGQVTGPTVSVDKFQIRVDITGPGITFPTDPILPPNPIRPDVEITSLLHD